jgi:molybdopterin-guanine dinucleotide biosynthesis protein A
VSELTLAILAGGEGRRLGGVAKGLIEIEGRTVIERLLALAPLAREVLLVANDPAPYARFGLRTVADVVAGKGAPGGVHAALAQARAPRVLAVACDMPFVTPEAIAPLLEAPARDVVVYGDGRIEPFPGLYAAHLASEWAARLDEAPSLQSLCRHFAHTLVPRERLRAVDPQGRALLSINTPEDLQRLRAALPDGPAGSSA